MRHRVRQSVMVVAVVLALTCLSSTVAQAQIQVGNHQPGVCRSAECAAPASTATRAYLMEPRPAHEARRSGWGDYWWILLLTAAALLAV